MASRKRRHEEISGDRSLPQAQSRVLSQAVRLWILPDKLEPNQLDEAREIARSLGALYASSIKFANLILTSVKAPKRVWLALRREAEGSQLSDDWLRQLNVLHIDWLAQTASNGIMQAYDAYRIALPVAEASSSSSSSTTTSPSSSAPVASSSSSSSQLPGSTSQQASTSQRLPPRSPSPPPPIPPPPPDWINSEYSCQRPSPLRSPLNQALVDELEVIRRQRALTSQRWSERSYSNCVSAIKAYPRQVSLENLREVKSLKGVGSKMIGIIQQYCQTGSIVEATQIRSDPANAILFTFMDLYGIGPVAARELYEDGCRTVDDVVAMGKSLATHLDVKDCLRILPDLRQPIPRREVEEIARLLWEEARGVLQGCREYTICGGYRRGKPRSNDVDVVICREAEEQDGLGPGDYGIHELVTKLKRRGLMAYNVNVMRHTEGDADNAVHLDVAEIVFLPPRSTLVPSPKHRRVDLVLCPPSIYGAAVLGWTGAKTFEKDLRRWAKTKGYKFHSTGLRLRETNKVVPTRTEEDVFELLGLRFMPPQWRNTDA